MLFSGRHLAQCLIVWSHCLTVMVSEVCLKLRKRRKAGGNWERQQRTFWSKGTCIISFCIDIISCWRQSSPAMGQRSKQADGLQMAFLGWSHSRTPLQSSDTQWCQGKATADIISSSALSSLCLWDPTCFQRTFSLSGSALWPEGSSYTQLANRRFLLLNARLMCLTNSSSQAASTPPVCVRVMAYVTPKQILNKVCSSQLVSLCWRETLRGQSVITATDGLSVYLAYCSN